MTKRPLLFIFIACAVSGCRVMSGAGAADHPGHDHIDPKAEVIQASQKIIGLKSLSARLEGTGQTGMTKDAEYVAPDRYHTKFRDDTGVDVEMIMVGKDAYIKSGDSWNKMPGDTSPTPTFRNKFTDDVLKTISDVKFDGEETVDGKKTDVYSYKLTTLVGNYPINQKIWVDQTSGLPIKTYEEYSEGVLKTLTTNYYSDRPITIDPPVK